MKTTDRVGMLAIGYSLCHRVYYHIRCDTRDADGHHHLRHHWRRDITPLVPFLHTFLDLNTTEVCGLLPMGALLSEGPFHERYVIINKKSCETMPSPSIFSLPSTVQPCTDLPSYGSKHTITFRLYFWW